MFPCRFWMESGYSISHLIKQNVQFTGQSSTGFSIYTNDMLKLDHLIDKLKQTFLQSLKGSNINTQMHN